MGPLIASREKDMTRMRRFWIGLASSCLLMGCSGSDAPESRTTSTEQEIEVPDSVREELVRLGAEDQEIRQDLSPERMQDTVFLKAMLQGDSVRTVRLRAIIEEYSWPDSPRLEGRRRVLRFSFFSIVTWTSFRRRVGSCSCQIRLARRPPLARGLGCVNWPTPTRSLSITPSLRIFGKLLASAFR